MQKEHQYPKMSIDLFVCKRFHDSISLPFKGSFHFSLTVLCPLSVIRWFLGLKVVFQSSINTTWFTFGFLKNIVYGAFTLFGMGTWPHFYHIQLENTALTRVRSPLLTSSRLISVPKVTEMFQFTLFNSSSFQIWRSMHYLKRHCLSYLSTSIQHSLRIHLKRF